MVLIVQENRTFNDFFATFPGADGTTKGKAKPNARCGITKEETIPLEKMGLVTRLHGTPHDLTHTYKGYVKARDGVAMDGFDDVIFRTGGYECMYPYQYTDPETSSHIGKWLGSTRSRSTCSRRKAATALPRIRT